LGSSERETIGALELVVAGKVRLRLRSGYFQSLSCADCVPFRFRNDGKEVLDPDNVRAGNVCDLPNLNLAEANST
jgi:hypothetical protein